MLAGGWFCCSGLTDLPFSVSQTLEQGPTSWAGDHGQAVGGQSETFPLVRYCLALELSM